MPVSKPAVAYPCEDFRMQKKFKRTERITVFFCKKGKGFKSARCLICSCPLDVIEVEIKGTISFPEGAEKVALEEFGLSSLHTINQP